MARLPQDLDTYTGCDCDQAIGLDPLAVGFLSRKAPFKTGNVPAGFLDKLIGYCHPKKTVCQTHGTRKSPFSNEHIVVQFDGVDHKLGASEIRIIGKDDIYAAPDLIFHYVRDHNYLPPDEFVQAVMTGPGPESAEYRALINTLRQF